ncbi:MAG: (d)CMP kinase [Candidatus Nanopelagicales bacterium]
MNDTLPAAARTAVVAVDGPSGSGKSSVSRGVAARLGLRYLDTGAMYRAMTWWMLHEGVDVDDASAVAARCAEPELLVGTDPAAPGISVDGVDVSQAIREEPVTAAVSAVAAVPEVRARLVLLQRDVVAEAGRAGTGAVVEGRDIGGVVLPDADVKVFLTADPSVRAARRAAEDAARGGAEADHDRVRGTEADLRRRDAHDSSRAASPLRRADGAVEVDATHLDLPQVIDAVVGLVVAAAGARATGSRA